MSYLIDTIEVFLLNNFIKISNRMKEFPIDFTIWLRLFSIKLLVILVKNMRDTNCTGRYFEEISNFLISHNYETVFLSWWQILVLVELLLCSLRVQLRIFQAKCVKLRSSFLLLNLWNVRTDNAFVLVDRF